MNNLRSSAADRTSGDGVTPGPSPCRLLGSVAGPLGGVGVGDEEEAAASTAS